MPAGVGSRDRRDEVTPPDGLGDPTPTDSTAPSPLFRPLRRSVKYPSRFPIQWDADFADIRRYKQKISVNQC